MSDTVTIYALLDETGIRYIGQTRQALQSRMREHLTDRRSGTLAKAAWLKDLMARGLRPQIVVLETTTVQQANTAEQRHIREARARGCQLLNGTCGGSRLRPPRSVEAPSTIRFPGDVLAELRQLAAQHERSFNGEVVWALREYMRRQANAPEGRQSNDHNHR